MKKYYTELINNRDKHNSNYIRSENNNGVIFYRNKEDNIIILEQNDYLNKFVILFFDEIDHNYLSLFSYLNDILDLEPIFMYSSLAQNTDYNLICFSEEILHEYFVINSFIEKVKKSTENEIIDINYLNHLTGKPIKRYCSDSVIHEFYCDFNIEKNKIISSFDSFDNKPYQIIKTIDDNGETIIKEVYEI